ncbi:MAG: hypothetical protein ACHQ9S_11220 [Candidatus Binatia bacterium]
MQEKRQSHSIASPMSGRLPLLIAAVLALVGGPAASLQVPYSLAESSDASLAQASPIGTLAYTPGRGLHVGDTGFTLGGYSNVNLLRDEGHRAALKLDDLSFFVIWDLTPRFHLFSELEFEDLVAVDDHGQGGTNNHVFIVERLHGDVNLSDQINIRLGKFLTPVGRWNVIHAQPLVWTTSRPLATLLPFDPHITGAMLFGSLFADANSVTYSLFGQFVNQLDSHPEPQQADRSGGARLEYAGSRAWSIGSSYLSFSSNGHWQHLGGLDALAQRGPVQLMGEAVVEAAPAGLGTQWGFYLQGVAEVLSNFYLVGRFEHFAQRQPRQAANLVIPGFAYRPAPYLLLKAEYLIADHPVEESPPGFKFSFAFLF